ncbi:MAG TPA: hypothetical protein VFQ36_08085 [Ktedonobacteraceae bacterium]|nr:hypothetical protein [Ktedonobacteraceae bacterium]
MSKLTSMMRSGKRMIVKTRTGFRATTKTALGRSDRGVSQDALRLEHATPGEGTLTSLGRPDQGVSQDALRPEHARPDAKNLTALGRPDRKASHDALEPQDDSKTSA